MSAPHPIRTLILARHGESEGNAARMFTGHSASPLTATGRRQAEALAEALADPRPAAIYSSDLVRAADTARPLAEHTGLALRLEPRLRERDMGDFVGVGFDTLRVQFPDAWRALAERDPEFTPPSGESHRACAARVSAAIEAILAAHDSGTIVVVSHGVALHHVLRHLLHADDTRLILATDNCGVHRFEWREGGVVRVAALNDTQHLLGITLES